jgi:hypothetical protein
MPENINAKLKTHTIEVLTMFGQLEEICRTNGEDRDAEEVLTFLRELRENFDLLVNLTNEVAEARQQDALVERALFALVRDVATEDEKHRLYERELGIRKDLTKRVHELRQLIKRDEIELFCMTLHQIADELDRSADEADEIRTAMEKVLPKEDELDEEIARLEQELKEVYEEKVVLHEKYVRFQVELAEKEEEWYHQLQLNSVYDRWTGAQEDILRQETEEFEQHVICSSCHTNMCDSVLQCHHPFCSECIDHLLGEGESLVCPICGKESKKKKVNPFLFKP